MHPIPHLSHKIPGITFKNNVIAFNPPKNLRFYYHIATINPTTIFFFLLCKRIYLSPIFNVKSSKSSSRLNSCQ